MYKFNLIAIVGIVAAVSLVVVGMASPLAFAANHENTTTTMGNMTGGGNATSTTGNMTETENITTAGETGYEYDPSNPRVP